MNFQRVRYPVLKADYHSGMEINMPGLRSPRFLTIKMTWALRPGLYRSMESFLGEACCVECVKGTVDVGERVQVTQPKLIQLVTEKKEVAPVPKFNRQVLTRSGEQPFIRPAAKNLLPD